MAKQMKVTDDHSIRVGPNTQLIRAGYSPFDYHGFINPPTVRASTVLFPDARTMETHGQKYTYGTRGTPTTDALCEAINELEGAAGTIILPSGLAAVTVTFLAYLSAGDHALVVDTVYGNVRHFCDSMLTRFGIEVEYYDPSLGAAIETLFKSNTKLVHTEAPGSNTFEMQDIPAIAAVAHRHGAVVTMDNTWATPINFRPLDFGVDVSIQASTKYPAGHADILMGTASANAKHWHPLQQAHGELGICGAADDAYQVLRGLRTMGVRLERHQASALAIAEWLESRDDVARVLHPALPSFPGHHIWKRDFNGASGVFSFVLAVSRGQNFRAKAQAFLDGLSLFGLGYSWGGFQSLALQVGLDERRILRAPDDGPVIRLQIGLEDVADLKTDLVRGFDAAREIF
ncbi:cystathionine beta-lyase (plasmid) [Microvirga lotononidis]|uniref:Cystathionine beta-lyase n=2 Tax=Microvirga lotononidis TaxID=864069 RepID=I4Z1B4_9HYPH|nr:cystathionine beta-lyase [Microvirga lotononidis]EIM30006.1 cystathionine beta-lyase [Microvirga lotononidis]WQO31944.1 cystathionine beta-lyase [Microvirga lotononidis]